eukprot:CAMPEP_0170133676 /NCGR_PEP_ID=MMETSP0033_2-20121228/1470_1 /TAXON_ID=195969 /ORGANISM="Dolichomastix tenuilepis, Strain CCMP3274" /LENGTH=1147 /DNA_ID=CAMNT_0010369195 /DNA_START=104 /DNA_END=3547 /DNA_ORIENTATION=-
MLSKTAAAGPSVPPMVLGYYLALAAAIAAVLLMPSGGSAPPPTPPPAAGWAWVGYGPPRFFWKQPPARQPTGTIPSSMDEVQDMLFKEGLVRDLNTVYQRLFRGSRGWRGRIANVVDATLDAVGLEEEAPAPVVAALVDGNCTLTEAEEERLPWDNWGACDAVCGLGMRVRIKAGGCGRVQESERCIGPLLLGCDNVCNSGKVDNGCGCGAPGPFGCNSACELDLIQEIDECGVCGGEGVALGCDGVCFSNIVNDDCGVCGGNNEAKGCDGVCHSGKELDYCDVCGGLNATLGCDSVCFSGLVNDDCGSCNGTNADKGCDGVCFSETEVDYCGVCGGLNATLDAFGICGNPSLYASCEGDEPPEECGAWLRANAPAPSPMMEEDEEEEPELEPEPEPVVEEEKEAAAAEVSEVFETNWGGENISDALASGVEALLAGNVTAACLEITPGKARPPHNWLPRWKAFPHTQRFYGGLSAAVDALLAGDIAGLRAALRQMWDALWTVEPEPVMCEPEPEPEAEEEPEPAEAEEEPEEKPDMCEGVWAMDTAAAALREAVPALRERDLEGVKAALDRAIVPSGWQINIALRCPPMDYWAALFGFVPLTPDELAALEAARLAEEEARLAAEAAAAAEAARLQELLDREEASRRMRDNCLAHYAEMRDTCLEAYVEMSETCTVQYKSSQLLCVTQYEERKRIIFGPSPDEAVPPKAAATAAAAAATDQAPPSPTTSLPSMVRESGIVQISNWLFDVAPDKEEPSSPEVTPVEEEAQEPEKEEEEQEQEDATAEEVEVEVPEEAEAETEAEPEEPEKRSAFVVFFSGLMDRARGLVSRRPSKPKTMLGKIRSQAYQLVKLAFKYNRTALFAFVLAGAGYMMGPSLVQMAASLISGKRGSAIGEAGVSYEGKRRSMQLLVATMRMESVGLDARARAAEAVRKLVAQKPHAVVREGGVAAALALLRSIRGEMTHRVRPGAVEAPEVIKARKECLQLFWDVSSNAEVRPAVRRLPEIFHAEAALEATATMRANLHSPQVVIDAAQAIWGAALAGGSPAQLKLVRSKEVIEAIILAVDRHIDDGDVSGKLAGALMALAVEGMRAQRELQEANAAHLVGLILQRHRTLKFHGEFASLVPWLDRCYSQYRRAAKSQNSAPA